jgi:hypothetical protein
MLLLKVIMNKLILMNKYILVKDMNVWMSSFFQYLNYVQIVFFSANENVF